jgi:uroporphyrinogen-III decarboxylase
MRRFTLAGIALIPFMAAPMALAASLAGCAARAAHEAPAAQFPNEEQKLLACLDLQDHIVDLYAREYVEHQGIALTSTERVAFRDGWAEELAKRGTFDRFEQSCFYSLTPNKYECGMQSSTTGGLVACMKLSMR